MSATSSPAPPRFQMPTSTRRRELMASAFKVWAFGATFFGMAMLIVFFVRLGIDVTQWFRVIPQAIEDRNLSTRDKAEKIKAEGLARVDKDMEIDLRGAADEAERQQIRKDYETLRAEKSKELDLTVQELLNNIKGLREDTSAGALIWHFLTVPGSNQAEDAGILPALLGSLFLMGITVAVAVPLGVGAAIYLEEYRSTSWFAQVIQVNINNLAGVPSVMYGILGAYVFVGLVFQPLHLKYDWIAARNVFGGGCTLALLSLPLIIVSAQEAIRAVPVSLRHASLALGATRWQTIWRVVLPSALPGTLTGIILSLSRALGEAAPLIMFGAELLVLQNPSLFSRFTLLPMQIFGWSERPADIWRYNAGLASAILVVVLLLLNGTAIYLRQRAQRKLKW
jgi:phosphate transport system permease protein